MLVKKKPTTPGQRHQITIKKNLLGKVKPLKPLVKRKKSYGGRNANGHITLRHRGDKLKKLLRLIDNNKIIKKGIVLSVDYDPNRSAFIARIFDLDDKKFSYMIATKNMFPGTIIKNVKNENVDIRIGNRAQIMYMPNGSILNSISIKKAQVATAAGTYCQLVQRGPVISKIKLPSGVTKAISSKEYATIGTVSNEMHNLQIIGKAGKSRMLGRRPKVRGVAMNPVDHPHGGAGGRPSVTPWGKPTKGQPTRKKNGKIKL